MKQHFTLIACLVLFILNNVSSQVIETMRPPVTGASQMFVNEQKRKIHITKPPVLINPKTVAQQTKWNVALAQRGIDHASEIPQHVLDSIKNSGHLMLNNGIANAFQADEEGETLGMAVTPVINNSFKGNAFNGWTPPDNNIAVSDDGYLVSVINTSIVFMDLGGNIQMEGNIDDILSFLQLTGGYFDPKVLYDPKEDKFIMVVLNGNIPSTSTVVVGFSTTSNPNDTWWFYTLSGDPEGMNVWFDYPSIGVSTDDVYISGNMYTADRDFSHTFIYQIEKAPGFAGDVLNGFSWNDVRDAYGNLDFNVVPLSFGFDGSVGPGIYLVSTDSKNGTEAMLYYTDNNANNNPNLNVFKVTIPNYYPPFDGTMKGTTDKLKTNDCRVLTGFYADGTVHFAFNTRGDDLHGKIQYCRINTFDLTQITLIFGQQPFEYAYPAIAPFSSSVTDKTILIGFLRTGGSIYPEFRVAACDHDMNYSGSLLIKEGESFVNYSYDGTLERWGDYSGIARRHSAQGLEVWVSGCYGEDNDQGEADILCTWIGQITDQQTAAAPVANFSANQTNIVAGTSVTFTDHSTNSPTSWSWIFPGGTPSTSNQQNPTVTYQVAGVYDVTLIATNAFGNDQEVKTSYVNVSQSMLAPVAEFTSDVTSIAAGYAVSFEDLSTNTPTAWQWFFPGGAPGVSNLQHPIVIYPEPGCYDVTLVAGNAAGTDVITKPCYIDVLTTGVEDVNSPFSRFVVFPNPVSGEKLNVEFELAQPAELDFFIVDHQGTVIRNLLHRRVKEGLSQLSFNTEPLLPGLYYIVIQDAQHAVLKSDEFIVAR